MSVAELQRWSRFEREEPFLGERVELMGGIMSSVIANVHRGKNAPPYDALDFMPIVSREHHRADEAAKRARHGMPEPVSEEDAILQRLVLAYG